MSPKKPEEVMRPLWSKEPCEQCGQEGYATRSMPRPKSDRYICGDCESYERAYKEGYEHGIEDGKKQANHDSAAFLPANPEHDKLVDELFAKRRGDVSTKPMSIGVVVDKTKASKLSDTALTSPAEAPCVTEEDDWFDYGAEAECIFERSVEVVKKEFGEIVEDRSVACVVQLMKTMTQLAVADMRLQRTKRE